MDKEIHIKFENGSEIETIPCDSDNVRGKRASECFAYFNSKEYLDEICKVYGLKLRQRLLIKYWYGSKVYEFISSLFGRRY